MYILLLSLFQTGNPAPDDVSMSIEGFAAEIIMDLLICREFIMYGCLTHHFSSKNVRKSRPVAERRKIRYLSFPGWKETSRGRFERLKLFLERVRKEIVTRERNHLQSLSSRFREDEIIARRGLQ